MRIVFDLQAVQTESRLRGIGRYTSALISTFAELAENHELIFVLTNLFPDTVENLRVGLLAPYANSIVIFNGIGPTRYMHELGSRNRRIQEAAYNCFIADLMPDIVMVMSPFEGYVDDAIALHASDQFVVGCVIYDLIPLIHHKDYLTPNPTFKTFYLNIIESIKNFDIFLTISEHARIEIIENLGVDSCKVANINGAVDAIFAPGPGRKNLESLIDGQFLLYTGGADPRKNLKRLLSAYSGLPNDLRKRYRLVLAGKIPEGERVILNSHARSLGLTNGEIVYAGFVSDETLRDLYAECSLFVFPSYHEGLGLPVLEAMKCGAAVIAANATSLPELVGLDEALFDPYDISSIRSKIEEALTDPALRSRLVINASLQGKRYSWQATARLALEAIEAAKIKPKLEFQEFAVARRKRYRQLITLIGDQLQQENSSPKPDPKNIAEDLAANQQQTRNAVRHIWGLPDRLSWRLEGPFDSTYSLALLNRETARALDSLGHDVALFSTEGPGDFEPNANFLRQNPDLLRLHERSKKVAVDACQVQSRNLYPPRVSDMDARLNLLHHYAWEESGFPNEWAEDFSDYLDGMTCLSSHVRKIMIDNGVAVPMTVSGCGIDHWERVVPTREFPLSAKSFRFLHVSSCFPRKGVDVLLDAYGLAFNKRDDVTLIIKTFSNPHNNVKFQVDERRRANPDYPDTIIIEEDLSDEDLKALYLASSALVAPSFAEGFGLPLAEAMLSGLPVITTGWGGQTDFCRPDTAWLLDYQFAPAKSHFEVPDSVWAVPSASGLAPVLREVMAAPAEVLKEKTRRGRELLLSKFRWRDVGVRLVESAKLFAHRSNLSQPRVGWVTTWQTRCGIAAYSEHLLSSWQGEHFIYARREGREDVDGSRVRFTWDENAEETLNDTLAAIDRDRIDFIVIQLNYGFFRFSVLADFIKAIHKRGCKIIAVLHSTIDPTHATDRKLEDIACELKLCDRVLVHTHNDLNRLKSLGLEDNVTIFPHGVVDFHVSFRAPDPDVVKIATYGFFLPHKGLIETIEAVHLLQQEGVRCQLTMINAEHPDPSSGALIAEAEHKIRQLGLSDRVTLNTDFLPDTESFRLLSDSDLLVFPYQATAESSSAAVRYGLAVGRPVAVSPSKIFDDVDEAVFRLNGSDAISIADGVRRIYAAISANDNDASNKASSARQWRQAHLYGSVSRRLQRIIQAIWLNQNAKTEQIDLR